MKTVWIIDGAYLYNYSARTRSFDYLKLKAELERVNDGPLYESYFLNSMPETATDQQNKFYSWLKTAAPVGPKFRLQLYKLKGQRTKCPQCDHEFERTVQKGVDVGIATLMLKLAAQGVYERLILSAGDGDFEDAISYIKSELHKEVWLCGSRTNLSPDLQSYSDRVLWLEDMSPAIDKAAP